MAIVAAEISLNRSSVITNDSTNGNVVDHTAEVVDSALNGVFPNITPSELVTGINIKRKLFRCNRNALNEILTNTLVYNTVTPADTYVRVFVGTDTDTQGDLTGSEDRYGSGLATVDISVSDTAFSLTTEGPGGDIFRIGDTVVIRDDTASNFETATIATVTVNTPTSTDITITGGGTVGAYTTAQNATISSALPTGDIGSTSTGVVVTSTLGTYDDVGSPITAQNVGGINDVWTVTFTDPTNYTVAGATTGAVGGGSIAGDFSPSNPSTATPYFTLLAAGFGGTFAASDTLVFTTSDSCVAFWSELIAEAGTAGQAAPDEVNLCLYGE